MNNFAYGYSPSFRGDIPSAPLAKPIKRVENLVNNTVDTFVPDESRTEEEKKSKHTAVKVVSTGLVLGTLLLMINPKSSGKMLEKFQEWSAKAGKNAKNRDDFVGKLYKACEKFFDGASGWTKMVSNANSFKDERFTYLCTKEKSFNFIKNNRIKDIAKKIDSAFVGVMRKPHELITKGFDSISRKTVHRKYAKVNLELEHLDEALVSYRSKLTPKEQKLFDAKLQELKNARSFFVKSRIESRLCNQEVIMKDLVDNFALKHNAYFDKFATRPTKIATWNSDNLIKDYKHMKDNLDFWAENIVMPQRNIVEQEGKRAVNALMGDGVKQKGAYKELLDIIAPHLSKEEKGIFEQTIQNSAIKLRKANKSECIDYFDKKRDLILGSAPTDILTAIIGFSASGIAISSADTKEDKWSKVLTVGLPVIGTLGTSMVLTSMLFSGTQGLLLGNLAGLGINKVGSTADKYLVKNKHKVGGDNA